MDAQRRTHIGVEQVSLDKYTRAERRDEIEGSDESEDGEPEGSVESPGWMELGPRKA